MALDKEKDLTLPQTRPSRTIKTNPISNRHTSKKSKTTLCCLSLTFSILIYLFFSSCVASTKSFRTSSTLATISQERTQKSSELISRIKPVSLHDILNKHLQNIYRSSPFRKRNNFPQTHHDATQTFMVLGKRMTLGGTGSPPNATAGSITTTATILTTATEILQTMTSITIPTTLFTSQTNQLPVESTSIIVKTSQLTETFTSMQPMTQSKPAQATESSVLVNQPGFSMPTESPILPGSPKSTESSVAPGLPTKSPISNVHSTTEIKSPGAASLTRPAISRQTIYTTTLPDGAISTLTSITVIPGTTEPIVSTTGTKTNGAASLQTNHARGIRSLGPQGLIGLFGIVIAGVM